MKNKKAAFDFSSSLAELAKINEWFAGENTDLDEGLSQFKRGMTLIKDCRTRLKKVENEFREVRARYEDKPPEDTTEE